MTLPDGPAMGARGLLRDCCDVRGESRSPSPSLLHFCGMMVVGCALYVAVCCFMSL